MFSEGEQPPTGPAAPRQGCPGERLCPSTTPGTQCGPSLLLRLHPLGITHVHHGQRRKSVIIVCSERRALQGNETQRLSAPQQGDLRAGVHSAPGAVGRGAGWRKFPVCIWGLITQCMRIRIHQAASLQFTRTAAWISCVL